MKFSICRFKDNGEDSHHVVCAFEAISMSADKESQFKKGMICFEENPVRIAHVMNATSKIRQGNMAKSQDTLQRDIIRKRMR